MAQPLSIYNSLTRKKEEFVSIVPNRVGLYVCGPTVYGEPHLGHARPAITFDLLFRYLTHIGYKVRYVRNITDVGHLENDADEGEDKIAKKARIEELEPMEIAQFYTLSYQKAMEQLNVLPPSIEPRASGHIIEQQQVVAKIISEGMAYESNGSVYFDVEKYSKSHHYGKLSGRILEDLYATTRELDGQSEKRNSFDFALWKKASPEHIMRWPSPWSDGFPGWHVECTAMSARYLGEEFDIHGGGMDLLFPHHECEIAQGTIAHGKEPSKYWMHNNMITINGQKMGKSLGNFINLNQFFRGDHPLLEKSYSAMTIRFFILQAHYRGTVDFSNDALLSAEKGLERLLEGCASLEKLSAGEKSTFDVKDWISKCYQALNDDLNSPILIAQLFEAVRQINLMKIGDASLTSDDLLEFSSAVKLFVHDILGLKSALESSSNNEAFSQAVDLLLNIRQEAKERKDWATSDKVRNELQKLGFEIKDSKEGFEWSLK